MACLGSKNNYYDYVALLIEHFDKNSNIGIGLNFGTRSHKTWKHEYPLQKLLESKYVSKEYLQLILNLFIKCKIGLKTETYDALIEMCKNNDNLKEYQSMIEQTYEKIKHFDIPKVKNSSL